MFKLLIGLMRRSDYAIPRSRRMRRGRPSSSRSRFESASDHGESPPTLRIITRESSRLVRGGIRRETVPDLHVVNPLIDGVGGGGVKRIHHDPVDAGIIDSH